MPTYIYHGETVRLKPGRYSNGRLALRLFAVIGEPVATATVNIPEADLADGEILVKDYSENEGMLAFLEENGLVEDTGRVISSGYVAVPVCKLKGPLVAFDP